MNRLKLLEKYPELKYISGIDKDRFLSNFIFKDINKNYILEGNNCPGLIFLLEGKIDIYTHNFEGNEVFLYRLNPGDYCHQSIYCNIENLSLDIIGYCIENIKIAILPIELARKSLFLNLRFQNSIYKKLYKSFIRVIQEKKEVLTLSVEERIVKYLKNINTDTIAITHSQLANYINASREAVTRNLKSLERRGFIKTKFGKINITNKLKECDIVTEKNMYLM